MKISLLIENLTNPALLFFVLGILAVRLKSDLRIPANSSKFISIYLLFSIGFKGGQELAHSAIGVELILQFIFAILIAILIPLYTFFLIRKKFGVENAGAIAAAYGSVSAVTFVTGISFIESFGFPSSGYMVAILALMEAPAIVVGVILVKKYANSSAQMKTRHLISHSLTNGSVLLILGSLIIGMLANDAQAEGIKPFTNDLFKGFLAIFLLDMGIVSGQKLKGLFQFGWTPLLFGTLIPLINGTIVALVSVYLTDQVGNRFILAVLAASASYIAVPAAMKMSVPKADPGLYLPMALAITFPVNITIGLPIYYAIIV